MSGPVEYIFNLSSDAAIFSSNHHLLPSDTFFIQVRIRHVLNHRKRQGEDDSFQPQGAMVVKSFWVRQSELVSDEAAEDIMYEILTSMEISIFVQLPIMRGISSFARTMIAEPCNAVRTAMPILLEIAIVEDAHVTGHKSSTRPTKRARL